MSNCGFSLLELLIAIFLSSILMASGMEIYLSLKKNYRLYQAQTQSDSEIRLARFQINQWIQLAGYQGCINPHSPVNKALAILGFTAKTIPKNYGILAKSDSDILVISECERYQGRWQFLKKAIYIGKTGRKDRKGKIIYALYDKKIPGKSEELAEHIRSLTVRYGLSDTSFSEVKTYHIAGRVSDWSSVISVEYRLNHFANSYVRLRERP